MDTNIEETKKTEFSNSQDSENHHNDDAIKNAELENELSHDETDSNEDEAAQELAEVEAWQVSEVESGQNKTMPVQSHINYKRKLKGQLQDKETELELLRKQVEKLNNDSIQHNSFLDPSVDESKGIPDPLDDDFAQKLDEYVGEQVRRKLVDHSASYEDKKIQAQQEEALKSRVEAHYIRAQKLIDDHGYQVEDYQKADRGFRQAIANVLGTQSDIISDQLLANLGDGSEKVVFMLNNSDRRDALERLLRDDRSGIQAAMYLGQLKNEATKPVKRRSTAPKPQTSVDGDSSVGSDLIAKLQNEYEKHDKAGDSQARFDAYRKLKKARDLQNKQ